MSAVVADYVSGLPIRRSELEAIGLVAAEWSYLESVIEAAIWNAVPHEDVGAAITTHLSWRARIEMLTTRSNLDCMHRNETGFLSSNEADSRREEFRQICRTLERLADGRTK
jgi:hypothetical protein